MRYQEISNNTHHEVHQKECDVCSMILNISVEKLSLDNSKNIYVQCECGNWIPFEVFIN